MRGKFMKPGQPAIWAAPGGKERRVEFVRRDRPVGRAAINIFIVPDFAGLNGPDDKGITHFSDKSVARTFRPVEAAR